MVFGSSVPMPGTPRRRTRARRDILASSKPADIRLVCDQLTVENSPVGQGKAREEPRQNASREDGQGEADRGGMGTASRSAEI
jgi:hypothetical protein